MALKGKAKAILVPRIPTILRHVQDLFWAFRAEGLIASLGSFLMKGHLGNLFLGPV